jgi:endonuclease G
MMRKKLDSRLNPGLKLSVSFKVRSNLTNFCSIVIASQRKKKQYMATKNTGYNPLFLGRNVRVALPQIGPELKPFVAPVKGSHNRVLAYRHYSVRQHAERGFPFFCCANIDGKQWKNIPRKSLFPSGKDDWDKDERLSPDHQWGEELYSATQSEFDKGHMTKREDTQWGKDEAEAKEGAVSTFFYPNAVPQHKDLNRRIWARLEDYILETETNPRQLRVSVFTGPALRPDDPFFVTDVDGERLQIPVWFWKIVYYTKSDKQLYRAAFLMNQTRLLEKDGVVRREIKPPKDEEKLFLTFAKAETYQINVELLERMTGLQFPKAIDPYTDSRPSELVMEDVVLEPRLPRLPSELQGTGIQKILGIRL